MINFFPAPLDPEQLRRLLVHPGAGGVSIFEGRVRNSHKGKSVRFLEYEAFETMAVHEMEGILREARDRFEVLEIECFHRTGRVDLGQVAVWIGVSAVHRTPAFYACAFLIDAIKHRLPIWKKEWYEDGESIWVDCHDESPVQAFPGRSWRRGL